MSLATQTYPVNGLAHSRDEDIRGVLDRWSNVLADDDDMPPVDKTPWLAIEVAHARVGADATNALHAVDCGLAASRYGEEPSCSRTRPRLLVKERKAAVPRQSYDGFEDPLVLRAGATQDEFVIFHPRRPHATACAAPQFDGKAYGWKPRGSTPAANQAGTATSCDIVAPRPLQPGGTPLVQILHEAAVEMLHGTCYSHRTTQSPARDPEDAGDASDDSGYTYNLLENPYDSASDGSSTRWSADAERGVETGRHDTGALYEPGSKYAQKHAGHLDASHCAAHVTNAEDRPCSTEGASYERPIDLTSDAGSSLASVESVRGCAGEYARPTPMGGWELERPWFDAAAIWRWRARVEAIERSWST
ncbi:hypothetical protein EWM64_g2649 [Hericium alpestre]|uniref:Uncharacterized protein n=1 Tax=Hericium alpestre TaxID=135208 RepID=A0A4Z0A3R6_9AGAM|nr:hypothetical protein EWM64_g2649 [Hericium alpestre]